MFPTCSPYFLRSAHSFTTFSHSISVWSSHLFHHLFKKWKVPKESGLLPQLSSIFNQMRGTSMFEITIFNGILSGGTPKKDFPLIINHGGCLKIGPLPQLLSISMGCFHSETLQPLGVPPFCRKAPQAAAQRGAAPGAAQRAGAPAGCHHGARGGASENRGKTRGEPWEKLGKTMVQLWCWWIFTDGTFRVQRKLI